MTEPPPDAIIAGTAKRLMRYVPFKFTPICRSHSPSSHVVTDPVVSMPVALFMIFVGLFVIISRRTALSQILGYIILENGVYAFGMVILAEVPVLVELGVLLDAFVAVFVMGVAIYHISREFDHVDADQLDTLKG